MSKFKSLKTSASLLTNPRLTKSGGSLPPRLVAATTQAPRRFTTTAASPSTKSSPFRAFITTGLRGVRSRHCDKNDFAYDLSKDEQLRYMSDCFKSAMKAVPEGERNLLKAGQRAAYLEQRYEQSPIHKYNYPVATSWRIGWLHNSARQGPTAAEASCCFGLR